MATIEVRVPDIGDFKDVPVIEIFVKPGDAIGAEESLVTLESDKATMDVPSPAAGTVKEVHVKLGDKVAEGTLIAVLEAAALTTAPSAQPSPAGGIGSSTEATPPVASAPPLPPAGEGRGEGRPVAVQAIARAHSPTRSGPR
jgi:pyruvate/2-oxoglutarate dehydrogenase complex dihydrolipoamide acyltransferase (E2) component